VTVKVVSLNIEGDKHLAEVIELIGRERPDLVCLQEVFEDDFKRFMGKFGMKGIFSPTVFIDKPGKPGFKKSGVFGVAMMGRLAGKFGAEYYFKRRGQDLPRYRGWPNAGHRTLVWQKIDNGPTVAATHFTWSKGGQATEKQRRELKKLMKLLVRIKPDILCGDFNAPRGARLRRGFGGQGEIWAKLAERFIDNIPAEIRTTLDQKLHYANGMELVVDGFFTPAPRRVRGSAMPVNRHGFTLPKNDVQVISLKLIGGVSDHLAIVAKLSINVRGREELSTVNYGQ